jgi:hypothetical protein
MLVPPTGVASTPPSSAGLQLCKPDSGLAPTYVVLMPGMAFAMCC